MRILFLYALMSGLLGLSFFGCRTDKPDSLSREHLAAVLHRQALGLDTALVSDPLLAHLLLCQVGTDSVGLALLRSRQQELSAGTLRCVFRHTLWCLTQEREYAIGFVEDYPLGQDLQRLEQAVRSSRFRAAGSPLQETLISLAMEDDRALDRLLATATAVDGASAETLADALRLLTALQPERLRLLADSLDLEPLLLRNSEGSR